MSDSYVITVTSEQLLRQRHDLHLLLAFGNPGALIDEDSRPGMAMRLQDINWLLGDEA